VGAFVTETGGVSSHAAILARSLRLPAVVSVRGVLQKIRGGERVLVNGTLGQVVLNPSPAQAEEARAEGEKRGELFLPARSAQPVYTADGVPVIFTANLTREDEAADAVRVGAMGVGLLRTEFLFMDRGQFLGEEEQYAAYRHVLESMAPHPVTIRTLDLGEDKHFDFENPVEQASPHCILGWRSIRLSLAHEGVFLDQLKALLRAAAHGTLRILLPMVNGAEEVRRVKELLVQAVDELRARNIPHQDKVQVGVMIETPAAAISPEILLAEADFISVGTNDLVQYVMVADRASEKMHAYYRSCSPIILKLLKNLAHTAGTMGKDASICGEIAGDPRYLPLLLGLGFRSFSVAPVLLLDLVQSAATYRIPECEDLAEKALRMTTADEVEALLIKFSA
ncbi:phosphoenolpyruvate--protein phosphotransferase, partial [candidate division FCPU426 bacterium]|nr:phosphoenolpyruvate--protein phosphotransferase [candidate division FCPU426 bacterium]